MNLRWDMDLTYTQCLFTTIFCFIDLSFAASIRLYMFDKCGQVRTLKDEGSFQLRILGKEFPAGINSCSVIFRSSKKDEEHVYYEVTNYTVSSDDIRLTITKEGNRDYEESFGAHRVPTLDQQHKFQEQLNVSVARTNFHIKSTFLIYINIYAKASPSALLQTALGYGIFALVVVVFLGYGCHRFSKRNSLSGRPHFPDCSRRWTQCLGNLCDSRASDVQAHVRTVSRPSVSPADDYEPSQPNMYDSDVGFNRGDNFHGGAHSFDIESFLNRSYSTDMSPNTSFPSSPMQRFPGSGGDERRSVTRHVDDISNVSTGSNVHAGRPRSLSAIELSTVGTVLNRSDDTNSVSSTMDMVSPSTTPSVQPSAPLYESGGTWGAHGFQGGPNSQNGTNDPPSYDDCMTTPPPPSYKEAVSGTKN